MSAGDLPRQARQKIGVALGGGAARGWAHVGVLRGLEALGFRPDVVAGTSAGALVGAAWALGRMDDFERWLNTLIKPRDLVNYFDFSLRGAILKGGLLKGERLFDFFSIHSADRPIEKLAIPFGAVATDLATGAEVWLRAGSLQAAVRASVSIPGLLKPVRIDGRWCVDGSLANPVPVTLCRALGANVVLAVDVNAGAFAEQRPFAAQDAGAGKAGDPTLLEVIERSLHILQERLTRPRLAEDPPDLLITPGVGQIGFLEFHRSQDALEAGRQAVDAVADQLSPFLS
jgi:NTE family protein